MRDLLTIISDKGEEVKNPINLADVICTWPLTVTASSTLSCTGVQSFRLSCEVRPGEGASHIAKAAGERARMGKIQRGKN